MKAAELSFPLQTEVTFIAYWATIVQLSIRSQLCLSYLEFKHREEQRAAEMEAGGPTMQSRRADAAGPGKEKRRETPEAQISGDTGIALCVEADYSQRIRGSRCNVSVSGQQLLPTDTQLQIKDIAGGDGGDGGGEGCTAEQDWENSGKEASGPGVDCSQPLVVVPGPLKKEMTEHLGGLRATGGQLLGGLAWSCRPIFNSLPPIADAHVGFVHRHTLWLGFRSTKLCM